MKKILEALLNTFAPAMGALLQEQFTNLFRRIKPVDKLASVLQSLYIPVDKELESIVKETKTPIDDYAVQALKSAIEIVASENNITLQNTDND